MMPDERRFCKSCGVRLERPQPGKRWTTFCGPCAKRRQLERLCAYQRRVEEQAQADAAALRNELAERECLRCGRKFMSTCRGHRICDRCRERNREVGRPRAGLTGLPRAGL